MFVPGAKSASAAGLTSDGAGRPGVGEAGGVGEGGGGVGEAGGVGEGGGGAPASTIRTDSNVPVFLLSAIAAMTFPSPETAMASVTNQFAAPGTPAST